MSNNTPTLFDDLFEQSPAEDIKKQKTNKKKEKKTTEPSAAAVSLFGELEIFEKAEIPASTDSDKIATEDKIAEPTAEVQVIPSTENNALSQLDKQLFSEIYQDFFTADAVLSTKEEEDQNEAILNQDELIPEEDADLSNFQIKENEEVTAYSQEEINDDTQLSSPMNSEEHSTLDDPLQIELPEWHLDKNYYTIGMVAKMFDVNVSHIRFWTNEFKLKPRTNRKGDRLYTPTLIHTLRLIHYLVKVQKHTIKGAKEKLAGRKKAINANLTLKDQLLALKNQLTSLRNNID